jgi:hydroxysqualene dehydroxylase
MPRTVHIIGAGLAGLAAAVRLAEAGTRMIVHEATGLVGGRCRSYHDRATDLVIDNGNHLLLSGNHAARSYLRTIGTEDRLIGPPDPRFDFIDLASSERWTLRLSEGRLPWWIFDTSRRVPDTRLAEYLSLARLLRVSGDPSVGEVIACEGLLYKRLVEPLLVAALNTEPREGSAALASAIVRETLAAGGAACRPLIARDGLSEAFITPALAFLEARGGELKLRHELRVIHFDGTRVRALDFGDGAVDVARDDAVVLAVPPYAAEPLVPGLRVPTAYRAIVNAHFRVDPPKDFPPMIGVLNATTEWIFAFPGRLSVTISNADRLLETPREQLAQTIWREVAKVAGIAQDLPPWQIVRERRATFAATPGENAKRPGAQTGWSNLVLAGDWTATGLPATIESAIRSGQRAASLLGA